LLGVTASPYTYNALFTCFDTLFTVRARSLNRVLRRIFGSKKDGVTGGWRKLHNEELHNMYSSPSIIRRMKLRWMRWAGHVALMGEKRNAYRILLGNPKRKRPLGSKRRRWVDNVDLREIGWDDVDWIDMAHHRDQWRSLVNTVLNIWVP
jgi:hypothetical protein